MSYMRGIQGGGGVANESDLVSQMSPLPSAGMRPKTKCVLVNALDPCLQTSQKEGARR